MVQIFDSGYFIRGISTETKERQWLVVGADYKPSLRPEGSQLRFLDVGLEAYSDGVGTDGGNHRFSWFVV